MQGERFYDFGPFRMDIKQRRLLRDGEEVALTPKAFDTLSMLVRNSSRVLEKDDLLKSVWPETFVEEATLAQNIFTLRKALGSSVGHQYIQTIPKRGYRFVAEVTPVMAEGTDMPVSQPETQPYKLPPVETIANERPIYSLAVLPLINEIHNPDAEFLSTGIVESIVNSLSVLPEIRIKACSTVLRYKGRELDPQEVGRELTVDTVLIGRVLQFDKNTVIRMELVDVENGWQLWGEEYKQELSELSKFQAMVTKDIAETLHLKLTSEKWQQLITPRTQNVKAYELYLKGRYFLNLCTKEGYKKAIEFFEQAVEIDSRFALAYSGLADSYIRYDFYGIMPPWKMIPNARTAAFKAVEMGSELAETHASLGGTKLVYDRDPVAAERQFKQAIRLNPQYAMAHDGYARCLAELGQMEESLAECKLALELDPFNLEINLHLGRHYLIAQQYDLAIGQLEKTLTLQPDFYNAIILLGIAYEQKKAYSKAIAEFHKASVIEKRPVLAGFLGYTYAMAGKKEEALEILDDLLAQSKRSYVPPYSIALIYTGLDKDDEALEWLERAFIEHSRWRSWLKIIPEFHSLGHDPRFHDLLQRSFIESKYNHISGI